MFTQWTGELAKEVRTQTTLPTDPILIPCTHTGPKSGSVCQVPGFLTLSLAFRSTTLIIWYTDTWRQNIHT